MNNTILMITLSTVFIILAVLFASLWVYKDAKQRGLNAGMWVLLVVLGGNFIGLILYLLIGRKQASAVCSHCGASTNKNGLFCSMCGERINTTTQVAQTNNRFLLASIACIVLVFVSLGLCLLFYFNADGFSFQKRYSYYHMGINSTAKMVSDSSSGNTWDLSFEEASSGYTFNKTYNAKSKPSSLSIDIQCDGTVQLMVTQDGTVINTTLGQGNSSYDLSTFDTGKLTMKIVNIDASSFTGKLTMERKD